MTRVLFVLPPAEDELVLPKGGHTGGWYGIGLPYIAAFLERTCDCIETSALIEFTTYYKDFKTKYEKKLEAFRPDYICMQVYSMNRISAFKLTELTHTYHPEMKVILGGHHVSVFAEQIVEKYPYVQCVRGEGEIAVLDIIMGWETGSIVQGKLIENLDTLPFPKHEWFFERDPDRNMACLMATRSCPKKCSFCCLPNVSYRKYRKRSVENIMAEIRYIHKRWPQVTRLVMQDDAFTLDNQLVIDLCKKLVEEDLHFKFIMASTVKPASEEMFYWMERAGLEHLYIGLETGNQFMLDRCHKGIQLEDVENVFRMLKKYPKLVVSTYLIAGLPGETWWTIENTVEFVKSLQRISYDFVDDATPIWAYPGTQLYEDMKGAGLIDDSYWFTDGKCPNWTVEHDEKELAEMREYLLRRVSFTRIFTPTGFYHQFFNAPLNVLKFMWYHPIFIKYALGMSFALMFPKLNKFLRGHKLQERWLLKGES